MPPQKTKKPKKIWNDDLVTALRARQEIARIAGKQSSITWQQGADSVEAIRQDIYIFSTGRIVGFPPPNKPLSKTVDTLCRQVMAGTAPILPDGYIPCNFHEQNQQQQQHPELENPYDNHHYNKSIKIRGGAFAILMAFYCSGLDNNHHHGGIGGSVSMSKSQLIRAAQPFCDEAMEGNFHVGRPHGAWKGIDTLKKHNLITVQKARVTWNEQRGGLRAQAGSENTYTLTRQGEMFVQALLKRHPEIQHQINSVRQGAAATGGGRTAASGPAAAAGVHRPFAAATTTATPVKNKFSESDGQSLLEWIQTATIGQQKEFCGLGKERRKYLHNLCDELSSSREFLREGKVLTHESSGSTARSRSLTIALEQQRPHTAAVPPRVINPYAKPAPTTAAAVVSPPPRAAAGTSTCGSSSESPLWQNDISPFAAAASADDDHDDGYGDDSFSSSFQQGGGNILNNNRTTPTKRKIPPSEAAAEAAELRRALFESAHLASQQENNKAAKNNIKSCTINAATALPFAKRRLMHSVKPERDDSSISSSEMDSKMPAKTTTTTAAQWFTTRPDILELLESDEDDDELLNSGPKFHKPPVVIKKTAATNVTTKSSSNKIDRSIIDLTEEDASSPLSPVPATVAAAAAAAASAPTLPVDDDEHDDDQLHHVNHLPDMSSITILIDNRERTRNCKPRYLRTELGRLLASGPLAVAWPQYIIPTPKVEERALVHGDFCFESHKQQQSVSVPADKETEATTTTLIPVCIERKRIADLVQRSASRDHWNQLQRMRDRAVVSIFLLEGDFRIAGTSVMPFSNNTSRDGGSSEWSASSHAIEDEEGILRFIARAILSTGLVRVIQTKDEQESLRAIAATGLVSATSNRVRQRELQQKQSGTPFSNTTMTSIQDEQTRLSDRLQVGGIPWQLAKSISQEIGSIPQLDRLYKSAKDKDCQSQLLIPVIQESCGALQSESSASSWSAAIRQVYFSTLSDATAGKKAFRAHEHLVTNHAALLEKLYSDERITHEEALDAALSASPKPDSKRKVSICLPVAFLDVLPSTSAGTADDDDDMVNHLAGNDETFYTAIINTALTPLPTIVLQTKDDCYQSKPVFVCILEGPDVTERLRSAMTTATSTPPSARTSNGLEAARVVAKKIHEECITSCNASWRVICQPKEKQHTPPPRQTIVLIVRGLRPALDRLAKGGGGSYFAEIRVVLDMVLAEVMISYNVIVLQAIRKTGDLERMVQEFALACFHFQLLTEKKKVTVE